ncbi:hypothetical protein [Gluconacetobacter sp.]|uniref:hypothetical protein n=1 Tax=Gluconacetobacter sp. TaxID=1935994 RepID=UPI0039E7FE30
MRADLNFIQKQVLDAVTGRIGLGNEAGGASAFCGGEAASAAGNAKSEFTRAAREAIQGSRRKMKITVKKEPSDHSFPGRISLDIFGLIITDDEKCGMQAFNASPAPEEGDPLSLNKLQREFLLRLALFVLRSDLEDSGQSSVSQWMEGFQAGLQSSLRAQRR